MGPISGLQDTLFTWGVASSKQPTQKMVRCLPKELAELRLPKRERFRMEPRAVRRQPMKHHKLKGSKDEVRQRLRKQLVKGLIYRRLNSDHTTDAAVSY